MSPRGVQAGKGGKGAGKGGKDGRQVYKMIVDFDKCVQKHQLLAKETTKAKAKYMGKYGKVKSKGKKWWRMQTDKWQKKERSAYFDWQDKHDEEYDSFAGSQKLSCQMNLPLKALTLKQLTLGSRALSLQ
mgnify:CR=1 FL=1